MQTALAVFIHIQQTGHKTDLMPRKVTANFQHYKTKAVRQAIETEKPDELNQREESFNLHLVSEAVFSKTNHKKVEQNRKRQQTNTISKNNNKL